MIPRGRSEESGAVAVMVALLAVLLLSMAALAVDLSNAYSRKRDVQTQADFAALAGGSYLGNSVDPLMYDEVAKYLNENYPQEDADGGPVTVSATTLKNGLSDDGEAYLGTWNPDPLIGFQPQKHTLTVVTPWVQVDFGLAGIMDFTATSVQAHATVQIRSPGAIEPFFMPAPCTADPVALKASSYNPGAPTFNPPSGNGNAIPALDSLDDYTVAEGTAQTLTITGQNFMIPTTTNEFVADFHLAGLTDRVPNDPTIGTELVSGSITLGVTAKDADTAMIELPPGVYNKAGTWYLRLKNSAGWSKDVQIFEVESPPPPEGCGQKSTGDFGLLDSPRKNVNQLSDATAINIADGLDHLPQAWDPPESAPTTPEMDTCQGMGGTPPPGAENDTYDNLIDGNPDDANCVGIKNGMNTDTVTRGMITGVDTADGKHYDGRLDAEPTDGCDRNPVSRLGVETNDDVLSCFLPDDGTTVGNIMGDANGWLNPAYEHVLDERVLDSPRFLWIPVIEQINPQNGYYPMIKYWPVFLTDESKFARYGASTATSSNGTIISNSQVVQLNVVPIHPDALPETTDSNAAKTIPWIGSGPRLVRLID